MVVNFYERLKLEVIKGTVYYNGGNKLLDKRQKEYF